MTRGQARAAWGSVILLATIGVCWAVSNSGREQNVAAEVKTPAVSSLLPADAVLYIGADGRKAHQQEFEKTAAYEALYKSGLADAFGKLLEYAFRKGAAKAGAGPEGFALFKKTFTTISDNGFSAAAAVTPDVGPPRPWLIVVLHNAEELQAPFDSTVRKLAGGKLTFETKTLRGRQVTRADVPAPGAPFKLEIGWWNEGKHLVLVGGANAVENALDVATAKKPNITANPLWKKYREGKADFSVTGVAWLDFGRLRSMFGGLPLPRRGGGGKPAAVNDVLKAVGLHNLDALVSRSGYRGRATWSETVLEAPGPRTGLLSLLDQKPISLDDLPPLPAATRNFHASSVDFSKGYTVLTDVIRNVAKFGPPGASAKVEGVLDQLPGIVGFVPKRDLFDTLGNVMCLYDDPGQGLFGIGSGMVIQLKDAKTLKRTINDGLERLGDAARGKLAVHRQKKAGGEIVTLEFAKGAFHLAFTITDKWLCVGFYPQAVETFLLRLNKKLPAWKPTAQHRTALAAVPGKFSAITVTDPRTTYRLLVGLAPLAYSIARFGLGTMGIDISDIPVSLADLPPAEVVTNPLFPNVSVSTVNASGVQWTSRSSLPGFFGVDKLTVTAVAVALLLPAVQAAREAARRLSSKDNLRQIGLALHNYHDAYRHFPYGTNQKTPGLKPEARLSWMADILPFIEQQPLYKRIDFKKGWNAGVNSKVAQMPISVFQNPQVGDDPNWEKGATHYVGIAGIGKDAPTLKLPHKRAGIFGYNRRTRIADITDGTANTLMVTEASKNYGHWAQGGAATIRAFTKKPYVNGPDGIGGPFKGGFNALFADGAVRFLNKKIDPSVLEKLATMQGGEVVRFPGPR